MIDPTRHHGLDIVRAVADEWGIDGDHTSAHHLGTIRLARVAEADGLTGDSTAIMSML